MRQVLDEVIPQFSTVMLSLDMIPQIRGLVFTMQAVRARMTSYSCCVEPEMLPCGFGGLAGVSAVGLVAGNEDQRRRCG